MIKHIKSYFIFKTANLRWQYQNIALFSSLAARYSLCLISNFPVHLTSFARIPLQCISRNIKLPSKLINWVTPPRQLSFPVGLLIEMIPVKLRWKWDGITVENSCTFILVYRDEDQSEPVVGVLVGRTLTVRLGKVPLGKVSLGKVSFGQISLGKPSLNKVSLDRVSKLVFYAQSTGAVISGRSWRFGKICLG